MIYLDEKSSHSTKHKGNRCATKMRSSIAGDRGMMPRRISMPTGCTGGVGRSIGMGGGVRFICSKCSCEKPDDNSRIHSDTVLECICVLYMC